MESFCLLYNLNIIYRFFLICKKCHIYFFSKKAGGSIAPLPLHSSAPDLLNPRSKHSSMVTPNISTIIAKFYSQWTNIFKIKIINTISITSTFPNIISAFIQKFTIHTLQEKQHWATTKIVAHTTFLSPLPKGLRKKSSQNSSLVSRRLCPGDNFCWAVAFVHANGWRLSL